jgi:hypothetical protein
LVFDLFPQENGLYHVKFAPFAFPMNHNGSAADVAGHDISPRKKKISQVM